MITSTRLAIRILPSRYLTTNPSKTIKEKVLKEKTPMGKLDKNEKGPYIDPSLPKHAGGVNPKTGETGGPAGLEPTRFGDWERKGRVTDF